MANTYTIRAADGQEYGPATLDQLIQWTQEGRVHPQTEVQRSDSETWAQAADYLELRSAFQPGPAGTAPRPFATSGAAGDAALVAQLKSGASWFYWIAGLSLVNSISAATGSDWRFILGLGITQVIDALGADMGGAGKMVTLGLDLLAASVLVLFGIFGYKRHLWAFVVGMALFALDGVIFLLASDWIGVGFHVFVLYCLFRGFQACRALGAD
jgi:hypothetical protein